MPKIFKHNGGGIPCDPETVVVVRFRNGHVCKPMSAGKWRWEEWPKGQTECDIVQWRIAEKGE